MITRGYGIAGGGEVVEGTVFVDGVIAYLEADAAVELEPDYVVVIEEEPEAEMDEEIYLE